MAEHDLTPDDGLGAAIAELPVAPERDDFWVELRAALSEPSPEQKTKKPQRFRRERALVLGLAVLGLIVGGIVALNVTLPSGSSPSCAAIVVWHHHSYYGNDEHHLVRFGAPLGQGTFPPCGDTPGGPAGSATAVKVYAIQGVAPSKAVAVAGWPTTRWERGLQ